MKLFDPGLEYAVEGDEANEGQRRQQYQAEGIERGADAGGCGDQPQGNEPGGHRADEDRCPAGRFGDRRGPCSLQGEMLGGHERDCARPRSRAACPGSRVLVTTRSLTSFQATAREQLSQQSRTGEPDEPGGHGQAHLEALALEDVRTGQREQVASVAVLAMIGAEPHTMVPGPRQAARSWIHLDRPRRFPRADGRCPVHPCCSRRARRACARPPTYYPAPSNARRRAVGEGVQVRSRFRIYAGLPLACRLASDEIRLLQ